MRRHQFAGGALALNGGFGIVFTAMIRHWFDWAATAIPQENEQIRALEAALEYRGNPSSPHSEGLSAKAFLEDSRARCARALSIPASELFFTSGATEANQIILYSLLTREKHCALLTSRAEHPSTKSCALMLERAGHRVLHAPLSASGQIRTGALLSLVEENSDIRMISLIAVQNETGAILKLRDLVPALRKVAGRRANGLHIHCDAVQAIGKIPFNPVDLDLDSMALSTHKLGGPRGAGLLWCRKNLSSLFSGGGQERGIRGGTENLFAAAGTAAALERSLEPEYRQRSFQRARSFERTILEALPASLSVFPPNRSVGDETYSPFIISLMHQDLPAEAVVRILDLKGISVSQSSACSSAKGRRDVLEAIGVRGDDALKVFRVSTGPGTTEADVTALLKALHEIRAPDMAGALQKSPDRDDNITP